jgi:hypothetical protein
LVFRFKRNVIQVLGLAALGGLLLAGFA